LALTSASKFANGAIQSPAIRRGSLTVAVRKATSSASKLCPSGAGRGEVNESKKEGHNGGRVIELTTNQTRRVFPKTESRQGPISSTVDSLADSSMLDS